MKSYECTTCHKRHFEAEIFYEMHLKAQSKTGVSTEFVMPDASSRFQLTVDFYKGFTLPRFLANCYNIGNAMMRYLTEHSVKFTMRADNGEEIFVYVQNNDENKRIYPNKRIFFITPVADRDNNRPMVDMENEIEAHNFARLILSESVK